MDGVNHERTIVRDLGELTRFLDFLDVPAWCKTLQNGIWVGAYFNHLYRREYGEYVMQRDKVLWGESVGQIFNKHDDMVFVTKQPRYSFEPISHPKKADMTMLLVCRKWYTLTASGEEFVCGRQLVPDVVDA